MVTVVDAFNFGRDFGSMDTIQDREMNESETQDHRSIVNLLTDQIEFANVIILNKADMVSPTQLGELKAVLHKLNPSARIIETAFSKIEPRAILNTGLFDFDEASQSAGWIQELNNWGAHTPETLEYGINSFVFRSKAPFHPQRFWDYLNENFPAHIIRSKGLFWLASRPADAINWSQAGGSLRAEKAGVWWASMPIAERLMYGAFIENQTYIERNWDKEFGDRQQEIVFIGQDLDKDMLTAELEACLCTPYEWQGIKAGAKVPDPFPVW
jgi:G3E family GTPase